MLIFVSLVDEHLMGVSLIGICLVIRNSLVLRSIWDTFMKKHTKVSLVLFVCATVLSVTTIADAKKVNSKESLRACKDSLNADLSEGARYKFKRNSATSVYPDRYKHLMNVVEFSDNGKTSLKVRCETTRTGEILAIDLKPGRWKI